MINVLQDILAIIRTGNNIERKGLIDIEWGHAVIPVFNDNIHNLLTLYCVNKE